jgi:hypothetical protein
MTPSFGGIAMRTITVTLPDEIAELKASIEKAITEADRDGWIDGETFMNEWNAEPDEEVAAS